MITRIWFSNSLFYLLLLPFSLLYGLITMIIKYSYSRGWKKTYHFSVPIVVIGNITVGGNGKTPIVQWLVTKLQNRGWKVGVVSRGYGGYSTHYPLVLDSNINNKQCGDEPFLIWKKTGAPVAVAPRRYQAVEALLKTQSLDLVVTDDGLQHYALGRDIEWVIIDGKRRFGNGWRLPAGPMREGISRLKNVQAVIVNGGSVYPGEIPMRLISNLAINLLSGESRSISQLVPMVAIAGIGHPQRFFSMVRSNGVIPIKEISFKDHQVYQQKMLDLIVSSDEQLIMTEKDAIKCFNFARPNWWYLPVEVIIPFNKTKKLLKSIENTIRFYCIKSKKSKN